MANRGKFITFEGCEGVGKSTQLRLIKEYCEQNGIEALFTREPGGCEISEKIRGVILDAANSEMTDRTELLLYCAARAQHTETVIMPALERGINVFCDRYCDSTAAYQGFARNIDYATVSVLNRAAMCGVKIDYTIFMDVPPDKGFARKGGAKGDDRLERETIEFHRRVYEGFKQIAEREPDRFLCFSAEGTKYETHAMILNKLKEIGVLR